MRRMRSAALVGTLAAACGPGAPPADPVLALEIRVDLPAPGATTAEAAVRVGMRGDPPPAIAGCGPIASGLRPLPASATVSVEIGGPVTLRDRGGIAEGAIGVLDRQLAWTPVGLQAEAAGGWWIHERRAAQVPEDPSLLAVVVQDDGSVTAHRAESGPAVSLEIDTAAGTWRCGAAGLQTTVPWWLAHGQTQRVFAVVERTQRHRTADGIEVVGHVRVRVPVDAAAAGGRQARSGARGGAHG